MFENLVVAMYSNGGSGRVIWAVKRQLTVSGTCQTWPFPGNLMGRWPIFGVSPVGERLGDLSFTVRLRGFKTLRSLKRNHLSGTYQQLSSFTCF